GKISRKGGGIRRTAMGIRCFASLLLLLSLSFSDFGRAVSSLDTDLGTARVVFQTAYGDIEFGFFPHVAPKTVKHIFKLVRLGCYNTNHFFRVDKGFVAQVADVVGGRTSPMNEEQRLEAEKTVVGEFSSVKHVRGILSMGRYSDPDSASSSFSILLGDAPHLDGQYAIFGRVTKGDDTLKKLEELPTRREGIFVMPTERITIFSTYYYDTRVENCEWEKENLKRRLSESLIEVERQVENEMPPVNGPEIILELCNSSLLGNTHTLSSSNSTDHPLSGSKTLELRPLPSANTLLEPLDRHQHQRMSSRRSRSRQSGSTRITDEQINELISKLQAVLPEARRGGNDRVSAAKVLQETCSHIRRLHREVDDLSERLSELLDSADLNSAQAAFIRSLLM
ncbi:unnamed protein product, partial [Musa hybrid cultivar]